MDGPGRDLGLRARHRDAAAGLGRGGGDPGEQGDEHDEERDHGDGGGDEGLRGRPVSEGPAREGRERERDHEFRMAGGAGRGVRASLTPRSVPTRNAIPLPSDTIAS